MKELFLTLLVLNAIFYVESISSTSSFWKPIRDALDSDSVTFMVALKQKNLDLLAKNALEVSDPDSNRYGEYWSKEDITNLIAPPRELSNQVAAFFSDKCRGAVVDNFSDAIQVKTSVACVESLFQVNMVYYQHISKDFKIIKRERNGQYVRIPSEIAPYIDFVTGISEFPPVRKSKTIPLDDQAIIKKELQNLKESNVGDFVFNFVIPETVRRVYNVPSDAKITNSSISQSVIEFEPLGAPLISDMITFAKESGETFTNISHIVGTWNPDAEGESTLDIEYQATLAPGADQYYITVKGWIYEMGVTLYNMPVTPLVNSVSYGWPESLSCESDVTNADCDGYTSQTYNARSDVELQKLALNGITVIVCSQDEGAPSEQNIDCSMDDVQPLWPIYPGCSPWATSVSATTLIDNSAFSTAANPPICSLGYTCAKGDLEYPCMTNNTFYQWTTGGGFSDYSTRLSYQDDAVNKWLSSGAITPPSRFFNATGRGYPDLSALGSRILIWEYGSVSVTAGTSASTPIISALISLLNDYRVNNGKKPLGFLNPLLYKMAAELPNSFTDVNVGNNKCTNGACCKYGYGASAGWDPVTGLGTPDYLQMLSYIKTVK